MGRRPIPVCGFGHAILYDETSTMRTYLYTMRDHPNMTKGVTEALFSNHWKKTKKFLNNP